MLNRIYLTVNKLTTRRNNWFFGSIALLLSIIMLGLRIPDMVAERMGYPDGQKMFTLDAGVFSDPARLYQVIANYGDVGRRVYFYNSVLFDIAYPLFYSLALATLLNFTIMRLLDETSPWRKLSLLPLLGGVMDIFENITFYALIAQYPARNDGLATISNYLTTGKTLISYPCFLLLLVSAVILKIRRKGKTVGQPDLVSDALASSPDPVRLAL